MVLITIVTGAYKPIYNWGASHCRGFPIDQLPRLITRGYITKLSHWVQVTWETLVKLPGWWFQTMEIDVPYIILMGRDPKPIDSYIFQDGYCTTNQLHS